jgi:hypothetical protein
VRGIIANRRRGSGRRRRSYPDNRDDRHRLGLATTLTPPWVEAEHDKLRKAGRIVALVFHRNGKRIKDLRGAWYAACTAAGCPGRILHDFRRTAVRNLERAGVPRSAAMSMVGHKTEAITVATPLWTRGRSATRPRTSIPPRAQFRAQRPASRTTRLPRNPPNDRVL